MMDLDGIAIFVKVVQAGSFSQAARLLDMPNSTVSAKVSALEKRLGVTLLRRTTRKLRLTETGEAYFRRSARALEELQAAENELEGARGEPHGVLRITAPGDAGREVVPALVHRYCEMYPRMKVELIITNRVIDLIAEGLDLAIRAGRLKDSALIAKRYELGRFGLWAGPDYLTREGVPRQPRDLAAHQLLRFTQTDGAIRLTDGKQSFHIAAAARLQADDFETLRALASLGDGIAFLPSFLCAGDENQQRLVRVLPQWRGEKVSLSIVYPAQKFVPAKVRAFIAVTDEVLKQR
jgi:DNA-binding transcriptional LysR family regulator